MILNRRHIPWALFVVLATAAAALLYLANFHPARLPFRFVLPAWLGPTPPQHGRVGGSPLGLIYGGVSFAIFIFAASYGLRRKFPAMRIGRMQTWLKAHIWFSVLTIPLIALHAGFSAGGPMTHLLLALYALVMLSGFFGLALQHFLPRLMKEAVPLETIFEQIPHVRQLLFDAAQKIRASLEPAPVEVVPAPEAVTAGAPAEPAPVAPPAPRPPDESEVLVKKTLDETILPYFAARRGDRMALGDARAAAEFFRTFKISVSPEWQSRIEDLQGWCEERRQLDLQTKLQHWLHGWLLVHAPASFLLLILTLWHAVAALFFY